MLRRTLDSPGVDPGVVGGYRLVRRLGSGVRAIVHLAHPVDGRGTGAVLKIFRPHVSQEDAERELHALVRAQGPHVVRLIDIATDARGHAVPVLERVPARDLASVLAGAEIRAGAAVTILAPIAGAVARMHEAGVAHCGLGPGTIRFDQQGAPVLIGFGKARLFAPGSSIAARDSNEWVGADVVSLRGIVSAVLDRVVAGDRQQADRVRRQLLDGTEPPFDAAYPARLAADVFELAEPLPVAFEPQSEPAGPPARIEVADQAAGRHESVDADSAPLPALLATGLIPEQLRAVLLRWWAASGLDRVIARVRAGLGTKWRVWLAVAIACGIVVLALASQPGAGEPPSEPETLTRAPATPGEDPATLDEDPAQAARKLLAEREGCFRRLSESCLELVHRPDSRAYSRDAALIRGAVDGGELDRTPLEVLGTNSVDRLGDIALVELRLASGGTASVLLMADERGWRLRDLSVAEPDSGGQGGQMPRSDSNAPASSRFFTAPRKRAASAPSMIR